jgi:hypothetical protein
MAALRKALQRVFTRIEPLPPGLYARKAAPDSPLPYRLHLRLEHDGRGVLLINAATILHLNPTAAEYAYHLVRGTSTEQVASSIAGRYRVAPEQAARDYAGFIDSVETLFLDPDRAPVSVEGLERQAPYSGTLSAPYRLDCALTYREFESGTPGAQLEPAGRPATRELTTVEWQIILDKSWAAGIPHVIFTGGEPALRPDLPALLEHAEQLGMVTGLVTGGQRLAESAYLDALLQAGLDHVMIVLNQEGVAPGDAGGELDLKALTGIIYWAETLEARLHIAAHLTLTPANAAVMPEWLERLAGTGVHAISLSASQQNLKHALRAARDRAAEFGLPLNWDLPVPYAEFNPVALEMGDDEQASGAGRAWLYVEPDGDVRPTPGADRVLGNMLRDPWEQIWSSSK